MKPPTLADIASGTADVRPGMMVDTGDTGGIPEVKAAEGAERRTLGEFRANLNLTLFQIEQEKVELIALREECETLEECAAVDKQIQEYIGLEIRKVTSIAALLKYFKSQGEVAKAEQQRALNHRIRWEGRYEHLKAMVLGVMQAMELVKVEGATDRLRRQKNPVGVEITDARAIPEKFLKVTVEMPYATWKQLLGSAAGYAPAVTAYTVTSAVDMGALKAACLAAEHVTHSYLNNRPQGVTDLEKYEVERLERLIKIPGARLVRTEHLRCE